jgi:hypothetical protein
MPDTNRNDQVRSGVDHWLDLSRDTDDMLKVAC